MQSPGELQARIYKTEMKQTDDPVCPKKASSVLIKRNDTLLTSSVPCFFMGGDLLQGLFCLGKQGSDE